MFHYIELEMLNTQDVKLFACLNKITDQKSAKCTSMQRYKPPGTQ